jgi:hypothetical protein
MANLCEQIEAEANHDLGSRSQRVCSFVNEDFVTQLLHEQATSVNWYALAPEKNEILSRSRACLYFSILFKGLPLLRTIE